MKTTTILLGFTAIANPLTAQLLEPGQPMPALVIPIHTQADDPVGGAYGTWAAGRDYKVSFHDGATFVPYLGGDYPHNQPFSWSTTSVSVGTEELVTRPQPLAQQASDTRYEFDHGGVVETYDVLLDGLEQTFVIGTGPAAGDLIVRGTVTTKLTAASVFDQHTAIAFVDHNGDVIVTYGAATAVDAAGRTTPMTTSFDDGEFELRLDGSWLENATYPVVVDPLMSTNVTLRRMVALNGDPTAVDVCRDNQNPIHNVWVSFIREVSGADQDLWVMRTSDNLPGQLIMAPFTDLSSSWGIDSAQLAHVHSRVVCAFVRIFLLSREIRWHAHHITDYSLQTGVAAFTHWINCWRIDIGGNLGTYDTRAMVVFQYDAGLPFANGPNSEARAFYIDFAGVTSQTGQGTAVDPITIYGGSTIDCERPRINQVARGTFLPTDHRCVVHQYFENTVPNDDWDVLVDIWDNSGNLLAYRTIEPHNGKHKLGPIVAGDLDRYLITYASADVNLVGPTDTTTGYELNAQRADFTFGSPLTFPHPPQQYLTSANRELETGGIAFDCSTLSHWLAVARNGDDMRADLLGHRGASVTSDLFFSHPGRRGAAVAFDRDNDTYLLVGSMAQPYSHPVVGNIWSHPAIPAASVAGGACSSASPSWTAMWPLPTSQRIGHEFSGISLSGVPAGALAVLGISLDTANISLNGIPGVGTGCSQLISTTTGFLGYLPIGFASPFGFVRWELPLPANFWPLTMQMQAFHLDASSSVFLSTQRLTVPIGY